MINPDWRKPEGTDISNWRLTPYSRWAFHNVRELIPTTLISATGIAENNTKQDFSSWPDSGALETLLTESHADCLVVLHKGTKTWQWNASHCDINKPHIVFSISKSITSMLAGILVGQGLIDVNENVVHYLPGTQYSAYRDCTVQQLLDMTVSLAFEESYLDMAGDYGRYRDATGWNPVDQLNPGSTLEPFLYGLQKAGIEHGVQFNYKSPNSDLLGLLLERVSGMPYAELLSTLIWRPMDAETDAYVTVDRSILARAAGGICITVNDLAHFGQLILDRGSVNGQQLIPEFWISDTFTNGDYAAWALGSYSQFLPQGRYRNKWYQIGNRDNCWAAIGIHGQWLYINPSTSVVIAKLSSQPEPLDEKLDILMLQTFERISHGFG